MTRAEKLAEAEAELADVKATLARLRSGGQSYAGEGRSMSRVQYDQLRDHEQELEAKVARLRRGPIQGYGVVLP